MNVDVERPKTARAEPSIGYRLRRETVSWMMRDGCTHAVTLNVNRALSVANLTRMFGNFCLDVDRRCLGRKNVSLVPSKDRLFGFAFWEHPHSNIHLHGAFRLDGWWRPQAPMHLTLDRIWLKITGGSGSTLLTPIRDSGWARYITKAANLRNGNFLLTADYHPR